MSDVAMVLAEDEAIELFTLLLTSARTQLDEPCRYASMRLLTAAEVLRDRIKERTSAQARALLDSTEDRTLFAQTHTNDAEAYASTLDELCASVARYLVGQIDRPSGGHG